LIEIINKQLLLQLVGYLCYWQMGFNSVFKGLKYCNNIEKYLQNNIHKELKSLFIFKGEVRNVNFEFLKSDLVCLKTPVEMCLMLCEYPCFLKELTQQIVD